MKNYDPKFIEAKWQKKWARAGHSKPKIAQRKYYILDMFPYPSGDGLHVGHVENYTATDILARFMRMRGYSVLHPIGWDAFGLPAENFAIKTGVHPEKKTHENIRNFTRQIKSLGMSYNWEHEIDTSSPEYYKWTQWMFLFLYKNGLAYKKKARVNWCPSCQTVLANEQVENGKCERCKSEVTQKDLEQWFFRITDFVEDSRAKTGKKINGLLSGLKKIDWPSSTKTAQENWIGRSKGEILKFKIQNSKNFKESKCIEVFTTRLDTIFGCTYAVVAPEHPLVTKSFNFQNKEEVKKYLEKTEKKTDLERTELAKEKTGVKLEGVEAINPLTGEKVPIFAADYVLGAYGTGAVMAVPAHDERDFEFAKKYRLPIKTVVVSNEKEYQTSGVKQQKNAKEVYIEDGVLTNSGEFTGLTSSEAREKMAKWLERKKLGTKKTQYRLRDWLVSRQRYWGASIPIIYCRTCSEIKNQKSKIKNANQNAKLKKISELEETEIGGVKHIVIPVPENQLPVKLPKDVDFRPTGESPLTRSKSFHRVKCPICGKKARRESDTLDTFVCSSWYYLRFADPTNKTKFADSKKLAKYLPVDFYMGGAEHTVLHLLYARFFTKALAKYGLLNFDEPFLKLRHQGIVLAEDGRKMSKSLGNVVNPDQVVKEFGADTLRLYEMFMGPLEDMKAWNMGSIVGLRRFLEKVWNLQKKVSGVRYRVSGGKNIENLLHQTIRKVTNDIENLKFNTAISSMMILANAMEKESTLSIKSYSLLVQLLSPFAPHISEELWSRLGMGNKGYIFFERWPKLNQKLLVFENVEIIVQINGKLRGKISVAAGNSEDDVKQMALANPRVAVHIADKEIRKVIYIKDKLLNLVV